MTARDLLATSLRCLLWLALIGVWVFPSSAWAQTITLPNTAFEIERQKRRADSELPLDISRQDCLDSADQRFGDGGTEEKGSTTWVVMQPQITGTIANNAALEVWVSEGADCATAAERGPNGNCSIVYRTGSVERNNTILLNPRDLVARAKDKTWDPSLDLPESICSEPNNLVDTALSVYIFLRTGGDTVDAQFVWEQTSLDLVAPPPPDTLTVKPGDKHLFFEWKIDSANEDPETLGFTFYCVPSGTMSTAGMGGAGGASAAGGLSEATGGAAEETGGDAGMGGAPALACDQNVLVDGELVSAENIEEYECGKVAGRATRRGQSDDVENGTTYAVAVAAYDVVGNSGVLKVSSSCLMPQEVTTFFEGYESAGGKGGGGFCAFGARGSEAFWWLLSLGAFVLLRRRKGCAK